MDKRDIEKYLQMLGQELEKKQVTGKVILFGGAVMLIDVENRGTTDDIDVFFDQEYATAIREAAKAVADNEGLRSDWFNDGVKGFLYTQVPCKLWKQYPGLDIYLVSLDYLLVMKVNAGRPKDIADAKALVEKLQISNPQNVLALIKKYLPEQLLTARIQYLVDEIFES